MAAGPQIVPITIIQGADLNLSFRWKPGGVVTPLTGYTALAQVRSRKVNGVLLLDFTGYMVLDNGGDLGRIDINVPGAITAGLSVNGYWDLKLIGPVTIRLLEGMVKLDAAVSVP